MGSPSRTVITSYLFNRHQRVELNPSSNEWNPISKGVQQGTILGPLLFPVFSIPVDHLFIYADDNCLSYAGNILERLRKP